MKIYVLCKNGRPVKESDWDDYVTGFRKKSEAEIHRRRGEEVVQYGPVKVKK